MSANQAKKIKVEVEDIKPVHPTDVTITYAIGSLPSVYLTYAPGDSEALKEALSPTSETILEDIRQAQENTFDIVKRWVLVNVIEEDSDEPSISFGGNANCPTYIFSTFNVSTSEQIIADCARVNSLDLSVYKLDVNYLRDTKILSSPNDDLSMAIHDIGVYLLDKADKEKSEDPNIKASIEKTDSLNKQNKDVFIQMFYDSYGEMGWDKLSKILGAAAWSQCVGRIINILQSNTGGFFNALLQLADEFQCIYVPDINWESPGKFINKMKIFDEPEPLVLNPISFNVSLGYSNMNPVGAVAVETSGMQPKYLRAIPATKLLFTYPDTEDISKIGSVLQVPGPPWLSDAVVPIYKEVEAEENAKKDNQSIGSRKEERSEAEGNAEEALPTVSDLLKQWAKAEYYWQCLGQTHCVVNCEFMNLEVGKYYMVYSEEGSLLFSGILYSITHNISAAQDTAKANSILNFSHVRISGAKIPGL